MQQLDRFEYAWTDFRYHDQLRGRISFLELDKITGSVYDIGCGDLFYLKDHFDQDSLLVGLDFAISALRCAKRNSLEYKNIYLVRGVAQYLPFRKPFETVLCIDTIHWNPGKEQQILHELVRLSTRNVTFSLHHKEDHYADYISAFDDEEVKRLCNNAGLEITKLIIYTGRDIFPDFTEERFVKEGLTPSTKINIHVECVKR